MEDTLRDTQWVRECDYTNVLILVLMEDTLRGVSTSYTYKTSIVLILVLMEDTLRESKDLCFFIYQYLRYV